MQTIDLSGVWQCDIPGVSAPMRVPGTLDESRIGFPEKEARPWHPDAHISEEMSGGAGIATRLTRRCTYEGPARITRELCCAVPQGKRVFLEVERARCLSLAWNGKTVPDFAPPTISTPHIFEVTGLLTGRDRVALIADNSYPGLPHDAIVFSSAATDETQTNWNGLLGYVRLRVEEPVFVSELRVYPKGDTLSVRATLSAGQAWRGDVSFASPALRKSARISVDTEAGECELALDDLPLAPDLRRWDEEEGWLYPLTASVAGFGEREISFGVRDFAANAAGRLTLNGRVIFLRGEANCAEFPEAGHPPMTVDEWTRVLATYRSYGVNCMRFHSHVPPEAAFVAADRMGMLMQPELSHWNPRTAFEDDESWRYYQAELREVLKQLANHPSFVMLTLGNELMAGELGHRRMDELLAAARALDRTRLYANASNAHYGELGCDPASDFYTAMGFHEHMLRATTPGMKGHLNERYPSACTDYEPAMAALRQTYAKPVFAFEVGQYEVLPDFDELADFQGASLPVNYEIIKRRVEQRGLEGVWKRYVEATGELSRLCYREEIEAVLRTESMSGISLLGLQDFPGQGTALVGMLNAHLQPKPFPFARPEAFRAFFTGVLPLALLERYTYEIGETLTVRIKMANYGKADLYDTLRYVLVGDGLRIEGALAEVAAMRGGLTELGALSIPLTGLRRATKLTLTLRFGGAINEYPLWVYPRVAPMRPDSVHQCERLDDAAKRVLASGGVVYLSPKSTKEALPQSIQGQFSTDFWSVGTFPFQEGGMGQLIDAEHPLFDGFPTDAHTDWQWWAMASQRAVILPERCEAIVTELDSYATLRPMAQLMECRCGGGRLLLSTLGLQELQQYPECRALLDCVYRYLASERFAPRQELPVETIESLVK